MLTFLRKIRKSVIDSGRARRYGLYAIGEIALVVIGILIALKINNWNQQQLDRKKERLLLEEVHAEFVFNKEELELNRKSYEDVRARCQKMITLFPIEEEQLNIDSLAICFREIDFNGSFDMSRGSIETLKNSYSFEIISNEELRTLLIQIDNWVTDYAAREERSIQFVERSFRPYLDQYIPFPYDQGIKENRVDLSFLKTILFENMVRHRVEKINVFLDLIEDEDQPLVHAIDRIIELSEHN